jgi:beta-lactamase class A
MTIFENIAKTAISSACHLFAKSNLHEDELAVALVDLSDRHKRRWSGFRENAAFYPASVIKLFYAVAAYRWLELGKIKLTEDFERAMKDMIVESSADATGYLIDLVTDTTSGPELSGTEMEEWSRKRAVVNDYFADLGYAHLNIKQKPLADGPFGRERQYRQQKLNGQVNTNRLTAKATAQLIIDIVEHKAASRANCARLLAHMHRDRTALESDDPNNQTHAFLGKILPPEAEYWSKAGWSSTVRHDAAYIEFPQNRKFCLVVFTANHSKEPDVIPFIGQEITRALDSYCAL